MSAVPEVVKEDEDTDDSVSVEPEVPETDTDGGDGGNTDPEPTADPEPEPEVEEVELTDDDLGGDAGDLFTGTETASSDQDDVEDEEEGDREDSAVEDPLDALGDRGESMEEAINDGAARLSVVGLDDEEEKEDLQDEFREVFGAFRLGYFGARFAEEYVFAGDDEEVDPVWGMLGSMLICAALVVWMRPDGDEMVDSAKEAVDGIVGGVV